MEKRFANAVEAWQFLDNNKLFKNDDGVSHLQMSLRISRIVINTVGKWKIYTGPWMTPQKNPYAFAHMKNAGQLTPYMCNAGWPGFDSNLISLGDTLDEALIELANKVLKFHGEV